MSDENNLSILMEIGGGHTIDFYYKGEHRSVVFLTLIADGKLMYCKDRDLETGSYVPKKFLVSLMKKIKRCETFKNAKGKRVAGR